ncbi:MAG: hypothetical protein VKO64_07350 [Candidatus Sericytochromatia bacterium]|nr:hypothetical protein [Candidatus Sericytochromatia bacterium]
MTQRVTGKISAVSAPLQAKVPAGGRGGESARMASDSLAISARSVEDEDVVAMTAEGAKALKEKVEAIEAVRRSGSGVVAAGLGASAVAAWAGLTESARLAELAKAVEAATGGVQSGKDLFNGQKDLRRHLEAMRAAQAQGLHYRPGVDALDSLSRLGRITATLDVVRGGVGAVQVGRVVANLARDPELFTQKATWDRLGAGVLDTLTGAGAALRLAGVGSVFVARLNPVAGIAADGVGLSRLASEIGDEGFSVGKAVGLARHAVSISGHTLMLVPGGQVWAVGLKTAALGLDLIQFGTENHQALVAGGKAAVDLAGHVAHRAHDFIEDPGPVSRELAVSMLADARKVVRLTGDKAEGVLRVARRMKDLMLDAVMPSGAASDARLAAPG